MKQSAVKTSTQRLPIFAVLFGGKDKTDRLVNMAWLFACTVLWNNQGFSGKEIEEAKYYIKDWLLKARNTGKAFINFCQRIILARQNVHALNTDYLALPSLWFDQDNPDGFAVTKEWLYSVKALRQSLPNFQNTIKELAIAIKDFSEEPTATTFQCWRKYFIEQDEPILLNIFSVYAANLHFDIQS